MKAIRNLRVIGLLEAASFLVLLLIAMPLKYVWHEPLAVKVVGPIHGVLFLAFVGALYLAHQERKWSVGFSTVLFLAAFLPFGPMLADRRLKAEQSTPPRGSGRS